MEQKQPLQSRRKGKKFVFRMTEPIRRLVDRMARERRCRDPAALPPSRIRHQTKSLPPASTSVPAPTRPLQRWYGRTEYKHQKILAVLSIVGKDFTLSNAVESVTGEATARNLVREIGRMHVQWLYCFDYPSYKRIMGFEETLRSFRKLKISPLKPFPVRRCQFCDTRPCHRWNAPAGISHLLQLPFEPFKHTNEQRSSAPCQVHRREKTVATLCIGLDGWTLCNGVQSTSENGRLNNSTIAQCVANTKVHTLICVDDYTHGKWSDIQTSYSFFFNTLQVENVHLTDIGDCVVCDKTACHKWKALIGFCAVSRKRKMLDLIPH